MGKRIADLLAEQSNCIAYIIDNNSEEKEYNGITIITYEEWWNRKCTDVVLLCSPINNDLFYNQLTLDGYQGKIVNVYEVMKDIYHNFEVPLDDLYALAGGEKLGYEYINELELDFLASKGKKKDELLRVLIYLLLSVRDYYYAENYIEKLKKSADYTRYANAVKEIRKMISQVVENKEIKDVLFVHIIDSLEDSMIERMPVLQKTAEEGFRIKGITVQYPITHYAINTLFTGKDVSEIELGTREISIDDSDLLRYMKKEHIQVTYAACNPDKLMETTETDFFDIRGCKMFISSILFEGLCCLDEMPESHMIVMHSINEIHAPNYSIGYKNRLIYLAKSLTLLSDEKVSLNDFSLQFNCAIDYVNKQLEWYLPYYQKTGCPNLIMGDHGGSCEFDYNLFYGTKQDLSWIGNKEKITLAFIISGLDKRKTVEGIIPNTSLSNILLDLLKLKSEQDELNLEKYVQKYAFLCAPPAYSENMNELLVPKGMYGLYEGFAGVATKEEIYLLSATGRELYFRPDEYRYRNLAHVNEWQDSKKKCKDLLQGREFPIEIYALEKYKYHLGMLEKYDEESFRKIMDRLSEKFLQSE